MSRNSEKGAGAVALALAAVLGVVMAVLGWQLLGQRPDLLWLSPGARWIAPLGLCAAYLVGAALLMLRRSMAPLSLVLALGAGAALVSGREGIRPTSPWADMYCLVWGEILAVSLLSVLVGLLARGAGRVGLVEGAAAGALAGLPVAAGLHLHCSLGGTPHGLVIHGGVVFLTAVLGAGAAVLITRRSGTGAPRPQPGAGASASR